MENKFNSKNFAKRHKKFMSGSQRVAVPPKMKDSDVALGTIGTGAQGAQLGMQLGGPYGAAIGGTLGLIGGYAMADAQRDKMQRAHDKAIENNNWVQSNSEAIQGEVDAARQVNPNYIAYGVNRDHAQRAKNGLSEIRIKPENKGKFTKSAKAAGQSVQKHATSVLNNPNATALQKKRANFAKNASKWKHEKGSKNTTQSRLIEIEGGEPVFRKDNTGNYHPVFYDPFGAKHEEGGIPFVAKEGDAIVTAKKNKGAEAIKEYKEGNQSKVKKIIKSMPEDKSGKKTKKPDGDGKITIGGYTLDPSNPAHKILIEQNKLKDSLNNLKTTNPTDLSGFIPTGYGQKVENGVLKRGIELNKPGDVKLQNKPASTKFDPVSYKNTVARWDKDMVENPDKLEKELDNLQVEPDLKYKKWLQERKNAKSSQQAFLSQEEPLIKPNFNAKINFNANPNPANFEGTQYETPKPTQAPSSTPVEEPKKTYTSEVPKPRFNPLEASSMINNLLSSQDYVQEKPLFLNLKGVDYADRSNPARRNNLQAMNLANAQARGVSGGSAGNYAANAANNATNYAQQRSNIDLGEAERFDQTRNMNNQIINQERTTNRGIADEVGQRNLQHMAASRAYWDQSMQDLSNLAQRDTKNWSDYDFAKFNDIRNQQQLDRMSEVEKDKLYFNFIQNPKAFASLTPNSSVWKAIKSKLRFSDQEMQDFQKMGQEERAAFLKSLNMQNNIPQQRSGNRSVNIKRLSGSEKIKSNLDYIDDVNNELSLTEKRALREKKASLRKGKNSSGHNSKFQTGLGSPIKYKEGTRNIVQSDKYSTSLVKPNKNWRDTLVTGVFPDGTDELTPVGMELDNNPLVGRAAKSIRKTVDTVQAHNLPEKEKKKRLELINEPGSEGSFTGKVVKIIDADTYDVEDNLTKEIKRVRPRGYDAHEIPKDKNYQHKTKSNQKYDPKNPNADVLIDSKGKEDLDYVLKNKYKIGDEIRITRGTEGTSIDTSKGKRFVGRPYNLNTLSQDTSDVSRQLSREGIFNPSKLENNSKYGGELYQKEREDSKFKKEVNKNKPNKSINNINKNKIDPNKIRLDSKIGSKLFELM